MRQNLRLFKLTRQQHSSVWVGAAVVAAVLGAVAAWMSYPPGPSPAAAVSGPSRPPAGELTRFRSDAWFLPDDEGFGFVEVPAGPFRMGSDPSVDSGAFENERWSATQAQGIVEVPAFYIGRYEVTVAQFKAFVEASRFTVVNAAALAAPLDHPVANVSWPDALAYCRWLEQMLKTTSQAPRLSALIRDGWHVTLPNEAEWEKAARGVDGRIYPWGSEPRPDRANYQSAAPVKVGSFACPECPFGLSDMSGNLWEWTRSPYQPYPFTPADDRQPLDADALWVMRGGHFADTARNIRAAIRGGADPGARRPFIGFRVVITATP